MSLRASEETFGKVEVYSSTMPLQMISISNDPPMTEDEAKSEGQRRLEADGYEVLEAVSAELEEDPTGSGRSTWHLGFQVGAPPPRV